MGDEPVEDTALDEHVSDRPAMDAKLTRRESTVVATVRQGRQLSCSDLSLDDLGGTSHPDHLIDGRLIRDLLLGRHGVLDPHGIMIVGARILGEFDLASVNACVGLNLSRCVIDTELDLGDAHFPWLSLEGCRCNTIRADGLRIDGNLVLRSQVEVAIQDAAVSLAGARIDGQLDMSGAVVTNAKGLALDADGLTVSGGVFLCEEFQATGATGAVRLIRAKIGGQFDVSRAILFSSGGSALHADGMEVDGTLVGSSLEARSEEGEAAVLLLGARIGDQLDLRRATLIGEAGAALIADRLHVEGSCFLGITLKPRAGAMAPTVWSDLWVLV